MADYDPKIIPVLDDIIETDFSENVASQLSSSAGLDGKERLPADNPDLLPSTPGDFADEDSEAGAAVIDNIDEPLKLETQAIDFEDIEFSALRTATAYQTETVSDIYATENSEDEPQHTNSALIDYHYDSAAGHKVASDSFFSVDDTAAGNLQPTVVNERSTGALTTAAIEPSTRTPVDTSSTTIMLESVVEDIVKQLIPDLEQQLRFLVQQALEDHLDDDVLARLSTKNNPQ